jgi:hypothetical protein
VLESFTVQQTALLVFAPQLILALSKFCKAMPVFLLLLIEKDRKPMEKLHCNINAIFINAVYIIANLV